MTRQVTNDVKELRKLKLDNRQVIRLVLPYDDFDGYTNPLGHFEKRLPPSAARISRLLCADSSVLASMQLHRKTFSKSIKSQPLYQKLVSSYLVAFPTPVGMLRQSA